MYWVEIIDSGVFKKVTFKDTFYSNRLIINRQMILVKEKSFGFLYMIKAFKNKPNVLVKIAFILLIIMSLNILKSYNITISNWQLIKKP